MELWRLLAASWISLICIASLNSYESCCSLVNPNYFIGNLMTWQDTHMSSAETDKSGLMIIVIGKTHFMSHSHPHTSHAPHSEL